MKRIKDMRAFKARAGVRVLTLEFDESGSLRSARVIACQESDEEVVSSALREILTVLSKAGPSPRFPHDAAATGRRL